MKTRTPFRLALVAALALCAIPATGQSWNTQAAQEYARALTRAFRFGFPRYTTVTLPTCGTSNLGAVAYDTTAATAKICSGTAWAAMGGGATVGSPVSGAAANSVLYADASANLASNATTLGFNAATNALNVGAASSTSPTDFVLAAQDAVTTADLAGASTYIDGGRGLGSAATGGAVIIRTCITGTTGTTQCTLTPRATFATGGAVTLNGPVSILPLLTTSVPLTVTNFGGGSSKTAIINNGTSTGNILEVQDNGSPRVTIANGGDAGFGGATPIAGVEFYNVGEGIFEWNSSTTTFPGSYGMMLTNTNTTANNSIDILYADVSAAAAGANYAGGINFEYTDHTNEYGYFNFYTRAADGLNIRLTVDNVSARTPTLALVSSGVSGVTVTETGALRGGTTEIAVTMAAINTARGGCPTCGVLGNVKMVTLPAKTQVVDALLVITEIAAGPATATLSCGRTATAYIDYIVASDFKQAANTLYGDGAAERGTNLTGYDLPSYTATTDVYCQILTAADTAALTTGTFKLILTTRLMP